MIRINLLPREERVQRRSTMQWNAGEMVIPVGVVVATLLIVAGFAVSQHSRVASLTRAIATPNVSRHASVAAQSAPGA